MHRTISITSDRDFRRIYKRGRNYAGPLVVVYAERDRARRSRLGITVTAKIGKAVVRNRIKRRIREAYRGMEDHIAPGFSLVIVARSRAKDAAYADIVNALWHHLKRLDLIVSPQADAIIVT